METVNIHDAKALFSEYLARVDLAALTTRTSITAQVFHGQSLSGCEPDQVEVSDAAIA